MTTLGELLKEIDVDVEGDDSGDNKDDFDINTLEGPAKAAFEKTQAEAEELKNELAKSQLVIKTMKDSFPIKKEKEVVDEEKKDKIKIGEVELEKDDPYAPIFKTLIDSVQGLRNEVVVDPNATFEEDLKTFAESNRDIVRYATDMDKILEVHPTLKSDIPTLYSLAKKSAERRDSKTKKSATTETTGTRGGDVIDIQDGKTIAEAFDLAEKKLGGKG